MKFNGLLLLLISVGCAGQTQLPAKTQSAYRESKTDLYGDPLPAGAIARMGTVRLQQEYREYGVYSVAFSPDGKTLASGGEDKTIRLWEVSTGKEMLTIDEHQDRIWSVAFAPDGKMLASGSDDKTVRLWEVGAGKEILRIEGHKDRVYSVAFSGNGDMLASGSNDNTVRLWQVPGGKEVVTLQGHQDRVNTVCFCRDGMMLASGSHDHTIRLWEISTGKELPRFGRQRDPIYSVAFSGDGHALASGSGNYGYRWAEGGRRARTSPDPASGDNVIRIYDVTTGRETLRLEGHQDSVISVAFTPDGRTLASVGLDHTIRLWDIISAKELHIYSASAWSVAFSPDGCRLASGMMNGTILVWDLSILPREQK